MDTDAKTKLRDLMRQRVSASKFSLNPRASIKRKAVTPSKFKRNRPPSPSQSVAGVIKIKQIIPAPDVETQQQLVHPPPIISRNDWNDDDNHDDGDDDNHDDGDDDDDDMNTKLAEEKTDDDHFNSEHTEPNKSVQDDEKDQVQDQDLENEYKLFEEEIQDDLEDDQDKDLNFRQLEDQRDLYEQQMLKEKAHLLRRKFNDIKSKSSTSDKNSEKRKPNPVIAQKDSSLNPESGDLENNGEVNGDDDDFDDDDESLYDWRKKSI